MSRARILIGVAAAGLAAWTLWALENRGTTETQFARLLVLDGQSSAAPERAGYWGRLWSPVRQWRVGTDYRRFLRRHPDHARAMVAYGCFLYDQHDEDEAVQWWQKAVATDPQLAVAYNNLGEHYSHTGRAIDGLRYFQKACDLEPTTAVFHYNWALVCSLFRREAHAIYGWDTEEALRRSLAEFRRARDLAPGDYTFSSAYAQAFYFLAKPDWEELGAAWQFCLTQPVDPVERQFIYGRLARVFMHLGRYAEARRWLAKMTAKQASSMRRALERKMEGLQNGAPEPEQFIGGRNRTPAPSP